ncbi:ABC transporter permease [Glaciihabitans sp. dw_435]|uniref:ABC transporter permease n=1 Tax=Glaciihabitans sp. dw_435 TaxID=2720081 RepID=UPI001BD57FC4|nr:ABC transporter permease [Glaciihabitans sp. dw_435]
MRPHTPWPRVGLVSVILGVVVSIIVVAFLWPTITSSVHDVPIAVAGNSQAVDQVTAALEKKAPGTFSVTVVGTRDAAVDLIKSRDVYGAIVLGDAPEVLTASAASPVASQMVSALAPVLQAQVTAGAAAQNAVTGAAAPVVVLTDVVPLASTDARGTALVASSFPLVLGGMLGGIITSLLVVGVWRRAAVAGIFAVIAGFSLAAILQFWFGALQSDYLVNVAIIALGIASITGVIVGAVALLGRAGVAVGPVLFLLIANPLSSAAQPVEFLAQPWGAIGQFLPPGAAATLLREHSYFPDSNMMFPWLVLGGWALLGLLLSIAGHFRSAGAATHTALAEAEAAEVAHHHEGTHVATAPHVGAHVAPEPSPTA